ncbi:MAG: chorismate-binding protein, partial [Bacteroidota bacterium]
MLGVSDGPGLTSWDDWISSQGQGLWIMGALPYEWKTEKDDRLASQIRPQINWPAVPGFVPKLLLVCLKGSDRVWILRNGISGWEKALHSPLPERFAHPVPEFQSNFSKERYLETVDRLRDHIREGDCYEINLAQTFSASYQRTSPWELFEALITVSPVPFATYFKHEDQHLISASPERFLQHRNGQ